MLADLFDSLGVDPQLRGPLLQGSLTFVGVLITGSIAIFTWWASTRKEAAHRSKDREMKRRDFQKALWAEIRSVWVSLFTLGTLKDRLWEIEQRFSDDERYVPFVPTTMSVIMTDRLVKDLDLLNEAEIVSVVEFYRQIRLIESFAVELRSPEYRNLGSSRRKDMLCDLLRMQDRSRKFAEASLEHLEECLKINRNQRLPALRTILEGSSLGQ